MDREVTVQVDLGRAAPIERVTVYCDGGGEGGVRYPDETLAQFAPAGPPAPVGAAGRGAPPPLPDLVAALDGGAAVTDFERPAPDGESFTSGHLEIRPPKPVRARYVALQFLRRGWGWLMLSEIEVYARGRNVAGGAAYSFLPQPSAPSAVKYADDGRLLTDGYVARSFLAHRVAGWSDTDEVTATVDLGAPRPIHEVTVHSLGGGRYGIFAPAQAELDLSSDGVSFRSVASTTAQDLGGNVCAYVPLALTPPGGQRARFVRVRVRPSEQWLMLSEISVR